MKELRDWMEKNVGGLREDRSTESYALEFLRTAHSNLILSQKIWYKLHPSFYDDKESICAGEHK